MMPDDRDRDNLTEMRIGAKKIVVGYDGSRQARDGLRLGELLARTAQAEMIVARVVAEAQGSEALTSELEVLLGDAGTPFAAVVLGGGSAPRALHELAEGDPEIGLIVLGSTHRAGLGKVLPGSTAQRLLSGAPCAVAVAPQGYSGADDGPLPPAEELFVIGVGFSGSEESSAALGLAARLAARVGGATLRVIAVGGYAAASPETVAAAQRAGVVDQRRDLQQLLHDRVAELPDELRAQPIFERGDPGLVLLAQAEKGVDLMVIGSRGYGPMKAALLGGVSARVVTAAPCPVLLTPRSAV
jgi:nucleotide-binding universal stress UspA family protein